MKVFDRPMSILDTAKERLSYPEDRTIEMLINQNAKNKE